MGYSGAVPSEDTSGERTRRGGMTKTGNAHLRRIVIDASIRTQFRSQQQTLDAQLVLGSNVAAGS